MGYGQKYHQKTENDFGFSPSSKDLLLYCLSAHCCQNTKVTAKHWKIIPVQPIKSKISITTENCNLLQYLLLCPIKNNLKQWINPRIMFPVVQQFYQTEVNNEYVIRGNAAVLKCSIPSFIADFVTVTSWTDSDGHQYGLNDQNYGISIMISN